MNQVESVDPEFLKSCARSPSDTLDAIIPLLRLRPHQPSCLRSEIAFLLLDQLVAVTRSIASFCRADGELALTAVYANAHSILALTRVQAELSNKFYYLTIHPADDLEVKRRFAFFALKAAHDYKKMRSLINNGSLPNSGDPADIIENSRIDSIIDQRRKQLLSLNIDQWPPFHALSQKLQTDALKGKVPSDCIPSDFDAALSERLNSTEHRHFKTLGNVAVHSSAFLLFTREAEGGVAPPLIGGLACTALFSTAMYLALCGLEANASIAETKGKLPDISVRFLRLLARRIKHPAYLYFADDPDAASA